MGNFVDLKVVEIYFACELKQRIKVPTKKKTTLDLIISNSNNRFYKKSLKMPSYRVVIPKVYYMNLSQTKSHQLLYFGLG